MRNYYRKSEGDTKKTSKGGKCFVCDEPGHFARDCPKVKAALAASPNPVLVTAHKLESDKETEWGLLESLCKDSLGADSSERAVYMVHRAVCGEEMGATTKKHETPVVPFEAWWNMKELSRKVILDLGCMRNVVGVQWANDVVSEWQQQQRWFRVLEEDEVFRFGDGNTLQSKYRLQLQATFGGKMGLLAFSVVPGPCPPLLSKQSHTQLGVQLDTEHHTMSSRKLHVKNYGLSETRAGHYTVPIDEFHVIEEAGEAEHEFSMEHHQEVGLVPHAVHECEVFGSEQQQFETAHRASHVCGEPAPMSDVRHCGSSDSTVSELVGSRVCGGAGIPNWRQLSGGGASSAPGRTTTSCEKGASHIDGSGPTSQGTRSRSRSPGSSHPGRRDSQVELYAHRAEGEDIDNKEVEQNQ